MRLMVQPPLPTQQLKEALVVKKLLVVLVLAVVAGAIAKKVSDK